MKIFLAQNHVYNKVILNMFKHFNGKVSRTSFIIYIQMLKSSYFMLSRGGMFLYLYVFKTCYIIIKTQIEKLLVIAMYLRNFWKTTENINFECLTVNRNFWSVFDIFIWHKNFIYFIYSFSLMDLQDCVLHILSRFLYTLKTLQGVPTYMLLYPDVNHFWNRV